MKKPIIILLILISILTFSSVVNGETIQGQQGVIDVSLHEHKQVPLNGDWEFYPTELLTPLDVTTRERPPAYIPVPESWRNIKIDGKPLSSFGYGTYRLTIEIPEKDVGKPKALSLYYIGSAYRIWINNEEYPGLGKVGTSAGEEVSELQRKLIFFEPKQEVVEIILQVSNFSFREGGIIREIIYGEPQGLVLSIFKETIFSLFILGGFFFIGMYHLCIFIMRRQELAILYLGLFALALFLRTLLLTEHIVMLLVPKLSWTTLVRLEYLVEIAAFLLLVFLVNTLYPKIAHKTVLVLSYILSAIFSVIIVLFPPAFFTKMLPYHMGIMIVFAAYFIFYVGIKVALARKEGAFLHFLGFIIITAALINDLLISMMFIQSFYMIELAIVIYILIQAVIVSNRYTRLFEENVQLTEELIDFNQSLEEKIEDRTKLLHEKNEQLMEAQETRTKMLANIAHDIGTPLIGVKTYLNLLKDGKTPNDIKQIVPTIIERLDYVGRLNEDLFELSKLEGKEVPFHFEKVTGKNLLNTVYNTFAPEINNLHKTLIMKKMETTSADKEAVVFIDIQRIIQVFQNYLDNAIKFSKQSDKLIEINCFIKRLTHGENEQDMLYVEVVDDGIGIEEQALGRVFDRLYKKREGNDSGSGLGLAIAKEIIEQHDGEVGVRSVNGKGSTFYFTLPIIGYE